MTMGNAASIDPSSDELDKPVDGDTRVKGKSGTNGEGKKKKKKKKKSGDGDGSAPNSPQYLQDMYAMQNQYGGQQQQYQQHQHEYPQETSNQVVDEDGAVAILLQYIPYYGQGDPSNDSIVRATLSGLSIDEVDSKDEYGNTLLLLACQYNCEDLVRILLQKGADPNAINSSGACCLHFACYKESSSINTARVLLQNGANPEITELSYGCTPLHYCAGTGEIEFCKLLLSNGAMVDTCDYYNYTAVDYAREANMHEVADFLQQRLSAFNNSQMGSRTLHSPASSGNVLGGIQDQAWVEHVDPLSKAKYYMNSRTGETLWESDLRARLAQEQQFLSHQQGAPPPMTQQENKDEESEEEESDDESVDDDGVDKKVAEAFLVQQTSRARLIGFLGKHDPARLVEVENLLAQYKGKEAEMLHTLCTKYNVDLAPELKGFQEKLNELKKQKDPNADTSKIYNGMTIVAPTSPTNIESKKPAGLSGELKLGGGSTPVSLRGSQNTNAPPTPSGSGGVPGGMDPSMVQNLMNEARLKYEAELETQKAEARNLLSEKNGMLTKLEAELDALKRSQVQNEQERAQMIQKLDRASAQGGEAMKGAEAELSRTQQENMELKLELSKAKEILASETEKLRSLESTMQNLSSDAQSAAEREREAAEQRAQEAFEKQAAHNHAIAALEEKSQAVEKALKDEVNRVKEASSLQERELQLASEAQRKAADEKLRNLELDMADRKAKMAQELSAAQLELEDRKKFAEESCKRADEAEALQRTMQQEVMEARQIQAFNDRLHKDLHREQLARKRLHNEMEDMKGRIRVYVRVRPFSGSENERGCSEACYKDGKLSVVVKNIGDANAKKTYDFDQVFGGKDGNSQKDIFRDTKHLIMSVIDGYNVCIFAYGQTGAGKSFTMIGAADIGECLHENGEFDDLAGITPRAVSELFRLLNERQAQMTFSVEVQMFQLYRDGLDDLLAEKKKPKKGEEEEKAPSMKITLAEHSPTGLVFVEGATSMMAETPVDVMKVFAKGSARRTTASTQMNAESSRSHLICSLIVRLKNRRSGQESIGKLTLVDLAGSERVDKSGATGDVLKEAQSINKSLSALGDVIAALTTGNKHVPYRNHPLTMLMSDSLGGNSKTLMFVNTSPADYNSAESNSSLAFASRCKDITNAVSQGPGVQTAQLNALKKQLSALKGGGGGKKKGLSRPTGK